MDNQQNNSSFAQAPAQGQTPSPAPISLPYTSPAANAQDTYYQPFAQSNPQPQSTTQPQAQTSFNQNPLPDPNAAEPGLKHTEKMGNGTLVKKYTDGRKTTIHPDGRTETMWPDGSTETVNPDGTKYHYTPNVPKEDYLDKGTTLFLQEIEQIGLEARELMKGV